MSKGLYNLAKNLEGLTIGKWYVQSKYKHKSSTGGSFSFGYEVINTADQSTGFLKALDFTSAFEDESHTAELLQAMTNAYSFEVGLLNKCSEKRLKYIVRIVDSGQFNLPEDQLPAGYSYCYPVSYLVLEKADTSMRNIIDISNSIDTSWILRSLHNIAVAIQEMHNLQIAHQDIKPSNVLLFEAQKRSKLGDVGRSSSIEMPAEHDELNVASYMDISILIGRFVDTVVTCSCLEI